MKTKITVSNLSLLLDAPHEDPVLYLERDEDTGEITGLGVWAEALVPNADIFLRHEELADQLSDNPTGEVLTGALDHLAEVYQFDLDRMLGEERYKPRIALRNSAKGTSMAMSRSRASTEEGTPASAPAPRTEPTIHISNSSARLRSSLESAP
ncbi:hypothetical protein [Streptomyces sp. NPDC007088]|uniref:hypothetical protein n=1 Tax=Streptomyces sp. NPDC007088 TaxID=3364773 RepID=UPI0036B563A2